MFQFTSAGVLTTLYSFESLGDGDAPTNGVFQDTNGSFFGTAMRGCLGAGTLYDVSVGLPPFVEPLPAPARVGGSVNILGSGLTGAFAVTFKGVPATFGVVSYSQIMATVPTGASSGEIQVTTSNGTLETGVPFLVLPTPPALFSELESMSSRARRQRLSAIQS